MRQAAESIQRRLRANEITGTAIEPVHEERTRFFFFKHKANVGYEVRVPFIHQGRDNREVYSATQHRALTANERLQRVIGQIMLEASVYHRNKGWQPFIEKWLDENGKHVGYKAGIREPPK